MICELGEPYPARVERVREAVRTGVFVRHADVHVTASPWVVSEWLRHERAHKSVLSRNSSERELEASMRVSGRQRLVVANVQLRHSMRALNRELLERTSHSTQRAGHIEKETRYLIGKSPTRRLAC